MFYYNKKYKVVITPSPTGGAKKTIQFGDKRYGQYKDKTPLKLYKSKDTLDKKRRKAYYNRHPKNYPRYSADWLSKKYLW